MTDDRTAAEITEQLLDFIRDRFLDGDLGRELSETTPLLQWGVLDSLKTAVLLNFIRTQFDVVVPAAQVSARNLKDVRSVAAMISSAPAPARQDGT
jgi:clorobiocin biosynthesis protein CloN5